MADVSPANNNYSSPAAPPQIPGYPQNPNPIKFSGFTGLNTKASQPGIGDQEMFVCDGLMPLGPNNLRVLRDLGTAIYTASGTTISSFGFANIGSTPVCIVSLANGSLVQVNTTTLATTTIAVAGTITTFPASFSQWGNKFVIIVSAQTNGYFLWDGTRLYKSGTLGPTVTIINGGGDYTSAPTITAQSVGAAASGYIEFAGNPSNGDTATFNGVVWTFVTGSPTGNQVQIQGSADFTVFQLENALNASTNPLLTVATYTQTSGPTRLNVLYDTTGTAGNAYTLAASVATPSAATLTGGLPGGGGMTFTGTVANGALIDVTVTNPGTGFASGDFPPVLTITGGGSDNMARASCTVSGNSGVESVLVNNGGAGYSNLLRVDSTTAGSTLQAVFSVVGQNGVVTEVIVQNPGLGYTSAPTLTITDLATSAIGTGAILTPVMRAGQIEGVTVASAGTGYTSQPTITVIGDGDGAILNATISAGSVSGITVVNPGLGYTTAQIQFNGGNDGAAATTQLMPFGISGTTVESYLSRVWVGNGRRGQYSSPGDDPANFDAPDGAGAFQSNDSFLKVAYQRFIQSNGFLYLLGDSSMNYISGVVTSGVPAITTFNNLNVDPQIGTPWPDTVQLFGRNLVFANSIGVYVSYGGSVTKISDPLDGIYTTVAEANWPSGFEPSAAVMTIFGIQVYVLLMCVLDQVTNSQVIKCLMWDGKKWWTSPQTGITNGFIATQEIDSVLTAYCTPENLTIKPMFTTATQASTMTKYLYSKLWDEPGVFTNKMLREWFAVVNVNSNSLAGTATGYISFAGNPSNGNTATFNGVVFTFVTGTPTGNQVQIQGTVEFTILQLQNALNASSNASLTVATYSVTTPAATRLNVTYNTTGTAGNAYTLAASVATPSGATLTGGTDPVAIYLAAISENGIDTEFSFSITQTGPTVIGPIAASGWGKLIGIRMRTNVEDAQINSITAFTQIQQTES